jgi:DNA uptake protein ComE-like DNA-binding protein
MTEQQLVSLKKQVDEAKSTVSGYKGHKQALMKQLKDDWGCITVEAAEKKLATMTKEINQLSTQIEEGITKLEEEYSE